MTGLELVTKFRQLSQDEVTPYLWEDDFVLDCLNEAEREAFYTKADVSLAVTTADGGVYRSDLRTLTLPAALTGAGTLTIKHAEITCGNGDYPCWATPAGANASGVTWYAVSGASRSGASCLVTAKVMGTIG